MEETEISMDEQHEAIHHHVEHSNERWLLHCALISAFLAVAAAVSGLYSSHFANEAMIEEIESSNQWSYYQAKGIKAMLTELRGQIAQSEGKPLPELAQKVENYKQEQQDIREKAQEAGNTSLGFMARHEGLSKAVTAFQIAIAVTAMAAICRRKAFLLLTLMLGLAGCEFLISALWV